MLPFAAAAGFNRFSNLDRVSDMLGGLVDAEVEVRQPCSDEGRGVVGGGPEPQDGAGVQVGEQAGVEAGAELADVATIAPGRGVVVIVGAEEDELARDDDVETAVGAAAVQKTSLFRCFHADRFT